MTMNSSERAKRALRQKQVMRDSKFQEDSLAKRRKWVVQTRPSYSKCSRANSQIFKSWSKIKYRWVRQVKWATQTETHLRLFQIRNQQNSWPLQIVRLNKDNSSNQSCHPQLIKISGTKILKLSNRSFRQKRRILNKKLKMLQVDQRAILQRTKIHFKVLVRNIQSHKLKRQQKK